MIEDIARYAQNNKTLASALKSLRHQSRIEPYESLVSSRDSVNDVLRPTQASEMKRTDLTSLLIANYKRAQESARVLEETFKIISQEQSESFKNIRYHLYALEKEHLSAYR